MTKKTPAPAQRRWIYRIFRVWSILGVLIFIWFANAYRTRDVDPNILQNSPTVSVLDQPTTLTFLPTQATPSTALIFICGSGVTAEAYAPLLHPIAKAGFAVYIIKLPYRFAFLPSQAQTAVNHVFDLISQTPAISHWVLAGHSLGGALACQAVKTHPSEISALVLVGTTHPKRDDLSWLEIPVTKIYASKDGIAPIEKVNANKRLLPEQTQWIGIAGGNHSQFGHYGHQVFDGSATISRQTQQDITRNVLIKTLTEISQQDRKP